MKSYIWILICFLGISAYAATEESKEEFTATLPDGTTIELVGLRNYSYLDLQQFKDGNFPWWRPDGTAIVEPPDTNNWRTSSSESYWFVIRVREGINHDFKAVGPYDRDLTVQPVKQKAQGFEQDDLRRFILQFASNQKQADIKLGLATGDWKVADRWSIEPRWTPYNLSLGSSDQLILRYPEQVGPDVIAEVTQVINERATRLVLFDKDGNRHESQGEIGGQGVGLVRYIHRFKNLDRSSIEHIEFQARPYEYWITFRNVSLQTGYKTQAEVDLKKPGTLLPGDALPNFDGIKINFPAQDRKNKMLLFCFFDMNQRPSRYCINQLIKYAEKLKREGVILVAIQASKIDENELSEWIKKNDIPFSVGMIEGDEEKIRFTWGVKSLPWLMMTDRKHIVRAEGFGLDGLGQKLNETAGITSGKAQVGPTQESSVSASTSARSLKEPEKPLQSKKSRPITSEPSNRQIRVVGVARDQNGKPIAGVEVQRLHGPRPVRTDPKGEFELVWDPKRNKPLVDTYYIIARHERENLSIVVEVPEFEQDTKTVNLNLLLGMIFSGKVVDPAGRGIEPARVSILLHTPTQGSGLYNTITDSEGIFEFRGIPAGHEYSFVAKASGFGTTWMHGIYAGHDFARKDFKLEPITLAIADQSVSGLVVDANDKPVPGARLWTDGKGQPNHNLRTDVEGKFTIDGVCTGNLRIFATVRGENRPSGYAITQGGATNVRIVLAEKPAPEGRRFVPKPPPSIIGGALPKLKDLKVNLLPTDTDDKMILICFFDMQQRPSRNCINQLAIQAEQLKQQGIIVVPVQASKIDGNALNEWVKENNIPFPVGMIESDEEKKRFTWGVKSLPWLILTDSEHIVQAEGFNNNELDEILVKEKKP